MDIRLLVSADANLAAALSRSRSSKSAFQRQVVPSSRASSCRSVRARSAAAAAPAAGGISGHSNYTVGDFMTRRDNLHVVQPTTPVDQALELLVQHRISGFPVVDDDWNLVGVVSDYDLLALDSMSGNELADTSTNMFPDVDSTWKVLGIPNLLVYLKHQGFQVDKSSRVDKTFHELQRILSKTNGKVIGDVMTSSPLAVRINTNLDAATRLLLETKYRRLPVVDSMGKLVGMITRGNVVSAALKIKKKTEEGA
ncbi:CBS domain-containing protein CBSX1 chloroplastic [Zea mays]|uniref:CBS domain-containing protein CBSX1 chloroplastic n=1 Tax=Zea mays TaxID=4577 RepID=A0A1D6EEX6_MAIZE|nr:CBS domain-containing protein CBSX1 chloroplastic [Zea mays]